METKSTASFIGLGILGLVLIFALLMIPSFSADTTIFLTNGSNGNSTGGGNVTSVNAGTGISVNQTTGNVLVTNTLPESTSGANVGNGANVFKNMTSAVLYFKTLLAGSDVSITNGTNTITITNTAPDNTACTNVGTGSQIYKDGECNFRTLGHGTGITLTNGTDVITINNSEPESTSGVNVGNGANVFKNMTGTVLYFKTLLAGTGIQVTNSTNTITLTNIGVTSLSGISPISASASTGSVTISCPTCATTDSNNILLDSSSPVDGSSSWTSGTFTAKKYIFIEIYIKLNNTAVTAGNIGIRFNGDTGANYDGVRLVGGSRSTSTSATSNIACSIDENFAYYTVGDIYNSASQKKGIHVNVVPLEFSNTAGNQECEMYGDWQNTSNAITSITLFRSTGTWLFDSTSTMVILGHD